MATITTNVARTYKDLDLLFNVHPIKKDVNKHTAEMAVINSIKNLVLTNHYERPFQPELGSNVSKLLFEQLDFVTASALEREILQTINNFEPRASVYRVKAIPDYDNNGFTVDMEFTIVNRTEPITITFFLERVR
jgi:phage baseplate assembly protein W